MARCTWTSTVTGDFSASGLILRPSRCSPTDVDVADETGSARGDADTRGQLNRGVARAGSHRDCVAPRRRTTQIDDDVAGAGGVPRSTTWCSLTTGPVASCMPQAPVHNATTAIAAATGDFISRFS